MLFAADVKYESLKVLRRKHNFITPQNKETFKSELFFTALFQLAIANLKTAKIEATAVKFTFRCIPNH